MGNGAADSGSKTMSDKSANRGALALSDLLKQLREQTGGDTDIREQVPANRLKALRFELRGDVVGHGQPVDLVGRTSVATHS